MSACRRHIRQIPLLFILAASSCVAFKESGVRGVYFKSDADHDAALQPYNNQDIPAFMRFSEDAAGAPSEWKSSTFCTQVDIRFPPKIAPGTTMPVQVVVSVAMSGNSQFDKNSDIGDAEVVKAGFMLGLGGSIQINKPDATAAGGSSIAFAASLFIQGDMEIVSRVPAENLYLTKPPGKPSPLAGTFWALKKWVAHKITNSALYKWFKNKKKAKLLGKMKELVTEIHKDLQGLNDAKSKAACEEFCKNNKDPNVCQPTKTTCANKPCSTVSASCDAGEKWSDHALVDFCGEYDRQGEKCEPQKDGRVDSDAIMDSATEKFIEFINELRTRGPALIAAKKAAYTARNSGANAYLKQIEEAWRLVYLGKAETDMQWTGYTYALKCRSIPQVYDKATGKIKSTSAHLVIMPLFCAWMRAGASLADAHTGWLGTDSRSNMNLKESLLVIYPELFPAAGTSEKSPDVEFEKWLAKMTAANAKDTSNYLGGWVSSTDHGIDINSMNVHALHMILSMPADAMLDQLSAAMDDIEATAGNVVSAQNAAKGCLATKKGCCGVQEVSLTGTWGVTVGQSIVGFCTPDTNPFQILDSRALKWSVNEELTPKFKGVCVLKSPELDPRSTTVTGVIPLDTDGNNYVYINLATEYDWGLLSGATFKKFTLGFSLLTKALNQPIGTTLTLTPICTALKWIWGKIKAGYDAIKTKILGKKPTAALATEVVVDTRLLLANSVTDYCKTNVGQCDKKPGEDVAGWLKAIVGTATTVDPSKLISKAGKWISTATAGAIKFGRDTYTQIDLRLVWDENGKMVMGTDADGNVGTGMSFGVESISNFGVDTGGMGLGSQIGVDIEANMYYGSGSSIDCGEA